MRVFNIEDFARFIVREVNLEHAQKVGLEAAAQIVQHEAKRVIGTYDYGWPELAESTKKDRVNKGFPENEPLLRSGELRDSIQYVVLNDHEAAVGSNLDIAVYQELGTKTIPPRSFLAGAANEKGREAAQVIGTAVAYAIASRNVDVEIIKMIGHMIKDVAHDVREMVEDDNEQHQKKH
jgi:phage gpG-like protein